MYLTTRWSLESEIQIRANEPYGEFKGPMVEIEFPPK